MDESEPKMKLVVFHDDAGRITHTARIDTASLAWCGQPYLEVAEWRPDYDATHYIDAAGKLAARPVINEIVSATVVMANGQDEVAIDGIPAGAQVLVIGPHSTQGEADGDRLHFTFVATGTYLVVVRLFPFIDKELAIHAI